MSANDVPTEDRPLLGYIALGVIVLLGISVWALVNLWPRTHEYELHDSVFGTSKHELTRVGWPATYRTQARSDTRGSDHKFPGIRVTSKFSATALAVNITLVICLAALTLAFGTCVLRLRCSLVSMIVAVLSIMVIACLLGVMEKATLPVDNWPE